MHMNDDPPPPQRGLWVLKLCAALVLANTLSLLASYHWMFDLFSNFKIQYFFIGLVLLVLCVLYKQKWFAMCMAILSISLFVEIQYAYTRPFAEQPAIAPNFKIIQYNKFFNNDNYAGIGAWLRTERPDVIVVNESLPHSVDNMQSFKDVLPYQYPPKKEQRFGDISILSKWPITVTPLRMDWDGEVLNVSKIIVRRPLLQPIVIYAYHAQVPLGGYAHEQRQYELETMARFVREEKEQNVIMMGDWNLTPWSPLFKDILKTTGLRYQHYGLMPQTTWPSFNHFDFLQIPIDQILYDDALILTNINRGPSVGSDHQSLIARFYVDRMP